MILAENIRLVVWDLDETFWRGTLTEGGIKEYVRAHHDIIIELARRGIMSSICSKNNLAEVREIFTREGLWDYFIFPSVDWSPKGARLAALVEAVQLRPETIMFIDDNPQNLAEAAAAVPGLQLADETFIAGMLANPLFKGKDDSALSRLAQYKLLERRSADMAKSASDNTEFLRGCNIRVTIETDIAKHLDRAIELINRTNQLNFTKLRLPENIDEAREALLARIANHASQAGLVHVADNYGDYGFCGFYLVHGGGDARKLIDFAFSCRILGMGVESWLYNRLCRPDLRISGEVLTDLSVPLEVDWVNQPRASEGAGQGGNPLAAEIRLRGGCDLDALVHYLKTGAVSTLADVNFTREGLFVRADHSLGILGVNLTLTAEIEREIAALGFTATDFSPGFMAPAEPGTVLIFSGWEDPFMHVYRHKTLDFQINVSIPRIFRILADSPFLTLDKYSDAQIARVFDDPDWDVSSRNRIIATINHLRANYIGRHGLSGPEIAANMRNIFDTLSSNMRLIVLLPHIWRRNPGGLVKMTRLEAYNELLRKTAAPYPNVHLVDVGKLVLDDGEINDGGHFNRQVYVRLYKEIVAMLQGEDARHLKSMFA
jgi:FkbH-like protein